MKLRRATASEGVMVRGLSDGMSVLADEIWEAVLMESTESEDISAVSSVASVPSVSLVSVDKLLLDLSN